MASSGSMAVVGAETIALAQAGAAVSGRIPVTLLRPYLGGTYAGALELLPRPLPGGILINTAAWWVVAWRSTRTTSPAWSSVHPISR